MVCLIQTRSQTHRGVVGEAGREAPRARPEPLSRPPPRADSSPGSRTALVEPALGATGTGAATATARMKTAPACTFPLQSPRPGSSHRPRAGLRVLLKVARSVSGRASTKGLLIGAPAPRSLGRMCACTSVFPGEAPSPAPAPAAPSPSASRVMALLVLSSREPHPSRGAWEGGREAAFPLGGVGQTVDTTQSASSPSLGEGGPLVA